ncbi:hypothetical protein VTI74DRAFT_6941 [Chaetomium olivicolor]
MMTAVDRSRLSSPSGDRLPSPGNLFRRDRHLGGHRFHSVSFSGPVEEGEWIANAGPLTAKRRSVSVAIPVNLCNFIPRTGCSASAASAEWQPRGIASSVGGTGRVALRRHKEWSLTVESWTTLLFLEANSEVVVASRRQIPQKHGSCNKHGQDLDTRQNMRHGLQKNIRMSLVGLVL